MVDVALKYDMKKLPKGKKPGDKWVAFDGNEYTIAWDCETLIDDDGVYRSPFTLRPLSDRFMEMQKYDIFDEAMIEAIHAAS